MFIIWPNVRDKKAGIREGNIFYRIIVRKKSTFFSHSTQARANAIGGGTLLALNEKYTSQIVT